jgi:hypothetical protein
MGQTTVNQRIEALVEHYSRGNKSAFAKVVGITSQSLGEIIGGRQSAPSFIALQKIALAYPSVRLEWLLLGEGKMLKPIEPNLEAANLEALAGQMLSQEDDYESRTGSKLPGRVVMPSENELLALLDKEDELRARLKHFKYLESGDPVVPWDELTPERQKTITAQRAETHTEYLATLRARMLMERAMLRQDAATNVYRIAGEADASKTYSGLLSERLNLDEEITLELVKQGHIKSVFIDGEGYLVSEQAVRKFLGEA